MSDVITYTLFQTIAVDSTGSTYDFPIWARDEADARTIWSTYLGAEDAVYFRITAL